MNPLPKYQVGDLVIRKKGPLKHKGIIVEISPRDSKTKQKQIIVYYIMMIPHKQEWAFAEFELDYAYDVFSGK
tara:strand:+ start:681 stop:899 length:219 start_codon:yes stop_codon:yes gene_type:complete